MEKAEQVPNIKQSMPNWQKEKICSDGKIQNAYTADLALFSIVKMLAACY
jgi:hypothetical protein